MASNLVNIKEITMGMVRFKFKGLVVKKTAVRKYCNGNGRVFSMEIKDDTASIRCLALNSEAYSFHDTIQLNETYYIFNATVAPILHKKYNETNHDWELHLTRHTVVEKSMDNNNNTLNLVPIRETITTLIPISNINSTLNKCTVKGYISSISIPQSLNNLQNSNEIFSAIIHDKTGKIRCIASRNDISKFLNSFENNKVYIISNAVAINKLTLLNDTNHKFELKLINNTTIISCPYENKTNYQTNVPVKSIIPISSVNLNTTDFTIKGRIIQLSYIQVPVENKTNIILNFVIQDKTKAINCETTDDCAIELFKLLEKSKTYMITNAQVFNKTNYKCELRLTTETIVTPRPDEYEHVVYNFHSINLIKEYMEDLQLKFDVLGLVKKVGELIDDTVLEKYKRKKRIVTLTDHTQKCIEFTLWNKTAIDFNPHDYTIIAIKNGILHERMIELDDGGFFKINPDIEEAHNLRKFFKLYDLRKNEREKLAESSSIGSGMFAQMMTLLQAKYLASTSEDNFPITFVCKANINFMNHENIIYKSCLTENCFQKVIQNEDKYGCRDCKCYYDTYKLRYEADLTLSDGSSTLYVKAPNDVVERLLGSTATQLLELEIIIGKEFIKKLIEKLFKLETYLFKIRIKCTYEQYHQTTHATIVDYSSVDYKSYNNYALEDMKNMIKAKNF